ncbi:MULTISPECIES: hypothetical protein [Paenibacillus]|uniref:Uncharacterized protein n=1 Tax=Paenibacillus peoriae TaxID=59893 RepID=A0ABU1QCT5_9BACL|nr:MULTISPECIES: hypothetical protein [Paenibacillus]MDR6777004.1 hypothetical protein [Paenibacillus peoriae]VUG05363.1 hypothetical protein PPOLYM_01743 [Paenibacillus polymyxa]
MKFTYTLSNIGWADVHLRIENSEIYTSPSYLSGAQAINLARLSI